MSIKGKLAFAGGSATGLKSKMLGATMHGEECQPLMDALDVTSMSYFGRSYAIPYNLPGFYLLPHLPISRDSLMTTSSYE